MKKHFSLLAALALVAFAFSAPNVFGDSKTGTGSTATTLIFGPTAGDQIRLTSVDATSDKAGSAVAVYSRSAAASAYLVNGAGSTSQAVIPLAATTGLSSNDMVVVSGSAIAPFKATLITVTSSNVTCSANLTSAVATGYQVFQMSQVYSIPVGSATVSRAAAPIAISPRKSPLLLQLDSTSAGALSATTQ